MPIKREAIEKIKNDTDLFNWIGEELEDCQDSTAKNQIITEIKKAIQYDIILSKDELINFKTVISNTHCMTIPPFYAKQLIPIIQYQLDHHQNFQAYHAAKKAYNNSEVKTVEQAIAYLGKAWVFFKNSGPVIHIIEYALKVDLNKANLEQVFNQVYAALTDDRSPLRDLCHERGALGFWQKLDWFCEFHGATRSFQAICHALKAAIPDKSEASKTLDTHTGRFRFFSTLVNKHCPSLCQTATRRQAKPSSAVIG